MKSSKIYLLAFGVFLANLVISIGLSYYLYQNFILPGAVKEMSDILIEANDGIGSNMPIGAKEKRQYVPEMSISFDYSQVSDQLLYTYFGDDEDSTKLAVINYAASSINAELKNARTFEDVFQAVEKTSDCRRLYAISNKPNLNNSGLEQSKYEKLRSVQLDDNSKLYIFKLKKSCEAKAGIGPDTHARIKEILFSAKSY